MTNVSPYNNIVKLNNTSYAWGQPFDRVSGS